MNPLRLTPPQWRILRYLGTYSAAAARTGFRADQLGEHTCTGLEHLYDLADAEYIAGRERGTGWGPAPDVVRDVTNPKRLNVHLIPAGHRAAELVCAAGDALLHMRLHGPLPADFLQDQVGTSGDVLDQLEQVGYVTTTTSGSYIAWRDARIVHVCQAITYADPRFTCTGCSMRPLAGATVWVGIRGESTGRYCDSCARREVKMLVPSALVTLTTQGRPYSDLYMSGVGAL